MEKPVCGNFSSGPCAKYSDWVAPSCKFVGRSHRSIDGIELIQKVIKLQKEVLKIPEDYFLGIVSASSTGAMEMLLWSLVGANKIDVLSHCVFSNHWGHDIVNELQIPDTRLIYADFPKMPDVKSINFDNDVVFCLSSTTSGVSFHDTEWIPFNRKGITICDAASAAFVLDFDWYKLDATAFSWQKGLGGEAGFGTIVLSPRAICRLESYKPDRPIPRIFRIAVDKKVNFSIFDGLTINTPSMICVEDFYNNLLWAQKLGGVKALSQKVEQNYDIVKKWIAQQNIFEFLVEDKYRAHHIACFDVKSDKYQSLSENEKWRFLKKMVSICEEERVGFDFLGHILTKPHLRIWIGPTIESDDLEKFLPWIEYSYSKVVQLF